MCVPTAIRLLEAEPARQLLPVRRGLRGDDLARGRAVERRALQLSPDFHLQEGNRYAHMETQISAVYHLRCLCWSQTENLGVWSFHLVLLKSRSILKTRSYDIFDLSYLKLLHLLVFCHQSHAGSPLWWRTLVSLGPWSLATRSTPCCVITVNRASSRDSPPLYAAGPTANGTSPKSPAQAVSTPV